MARNGPRALKSYQMRDFFGRVNRERCAFGTEFELLAKSQASKAAVKEVLGTECIKAGYRGTVRFVVRREAQTEEAGAKMNLTL